MTRDNYKVRVAGGFREEEEEISPSKTVGEALKQIQVSLRYVRHLPDDDVAPLRFAQGRFHLRSSSTLSLLRLIVLSVS